MMKTPHKHAELIKAWADGAEIECWSEFHSKWIYAPCPNWHESSKYRIKPEPKTDIFSFVGATSILGWNKNQTIKITFDGETRKFKSMELI